MDARRHLVEFLIGYCLIDSFHNFTTENQPYPFVDRTRILPGSAVATDEASLQNTALIFLLDCELPRGLNKHFRLRGSTRVSWRNLQRLAPHLDFSDYKSVHCRLDAPEAPTLLTRLCTLDYALLAGPGSRDTATPPLEVTHMHVKVERLTDNAIKELGKTLGYIERRLFERGEDYVDALEAKFFEYYGFSCNASGRRSAAAVAAQLFAHAGIRFSVFVASAEDPRLAVLDDSDLLTQYLLIRPEAGTLRTTANELLDPEEYAVLRDGGRPVLLYRVRFRRTAAALPHRPRNNRNLDEPWLEIADEAILGPLGSREPPQPVIWSRG